MISRLTHWLKAGMTRGMKVLAFAGFWVASGSVAQAGWHIDYVQFGSDRYVLAVNEEKDEVIVLGIDNSNELHPNPYTSDKSGDSWDGYVKWAGDRDVILQAIKDGRINYIPPQDMMEFQKEFFELVGEGGGFNGGIIPYWNPGVDDESGSTAPELVLKEDDFALEYVAVVSGVGSFGSFAGGPEGEGPQGEGPGSLIIRWGKKGGGGSGGGSGDGDGDSNTDQMGVSFGFVGGDGEDLVIHPQAR